MNYKGDCRTAPATPGLLKRSLLGRGKFFVVALISTRRQKAYILALGLDVFGLLVDVGEIVNKRCNILSKLPWDLQVE